VEGEVALQCCLLAIISVCVFIRLFLVAFCGDFGYGVIVDRELQLTAIAGDVTGIHQISLGFIYDLRVGKCEEECIVRYSVVKMCIRERRLWPRESVGKGVRPVLSI